MKDYIKSNSVVAGTLISDRYNQTRPLLTKCYFHRIFFIDNESRVSSVINMGPSELNAL